MEKKIRESVDRSLDELKKIQDKVDEFMDDLPEEGREIRDSARKALGQINELLSNSARKAADQADEAQLQAHLGLMEAQERLEASRAVVDDYVARATKESRQLLDEAELKRHLAMMEAQDFWEKRGNHLAEEFRASANTMQSLAERAMQDMQSAFSRWNSQFKNDK